MVTVDANKAGKKNTAVMEFDATATVRGFSSYKTKFETVTLFYPKVYTALFVFDTTFRNFSSLLLFKFKTGMLTSIKKKHPT